MTESIQLAPGTLWKNPWSGATVEVLSIEDGEVIARDQESGEEKRFPSTTAFMKAHVSA